MASTGSGVRCRLVADSRCGDGEAARADRQHQDGGLPRVPHVSSSRRGASFKGSPPWCAHPVEVMGPIPRGQRLSFKDKGRREGTPPSTCRVRRRPAGWGRQTPQALGPRACRVSPQASTHRAENRADGAEARSAPPPSPCRPRPSEAAGGRGASLSRKQVVDQTGKPKFTY